MYICDTSTLRDFGSIERLEILEKVLPGFMLTEQVHAEYDKFRSTLTTTSGSVDMNAVTTGTANIVLEYTVITLSQNTGSQIPLSPDDSLVQYAKLLRCTVITSDNPIRKKCIEQGIPVHGTVYIFRELVKKGEVSEGEAFDLYNLMRTKVRKLPKYLNISDFINK